MKIVPLPVFEADADPANRSALTLEEQHAALKPPKTLVVRFGAMKLIGEYPYDGTMRPGCGSKLVARTHRGTEMTEMLTTTCGNSGCGKSISRSDMLQYIQNSGGRDYPFHTQGRVLRVATVGDMNRQSAIMAEKPTYLREARAKAAELGFNIKIVDAEPILGGELLTFYYLSEERIDFRPLVQALAERFSTRIDMWQVGARDEARLVADYERCGQHCCCKNFLKVLKPISMRQAKQQKGTLDPLKISGRCGRLMCCLRYEDQTYQELKSRLPHKNTRVGTEEGPGVVVETRILVQLALVRLDHDGREIAVPVEELMKPDECPQPAAAAPATGAGPAGQASPGTAAPGGGGGGRGGRDDRRPRSQDRRGGGQDRPRRQGGQEGGRRMPGPDARQQAFRDRVAREGQHEHQPDDPNSPPKQGEPNVTPGSQAQEPSGEPGAGGGGRKRRRRRRRRRRGGGGDGGGEGGGPGDGGGAPSGPSA